ncbi:MAG: class I SAM-dependent methyltransferase [Microcystis sp. M038S2]|uniref:class I SAM-dependent methyltransferase n=1 Tax=unclassified Microcystis TaxID=2643300 RepID=UPI002586A387|nr:MULTISPECIES: class I SAM-dependent methyltransferase [unclassified Microcystis]NCR18247.1 class I SAM-dependent methyltransferase [Microcystis aeruginosa LL13-03]MCA2683603.1 class I SAM-dependent methyltransferase [Microcystis sp. M046S2]MCA2705766.1 class I SAM-dependent methyltransferase [Microcystis sp. M038S2]MCA2947591.1 class I SAM-dependent methyltransferase [Microcystis sp. M109S1]MCA2950064.1 class I SAM-dependent methyltransferase [Microcystis sp. M112S1]
MQLDTNSIQAAGYALMDDAQAMLLSGNAKAGMDHVILGMREIKNRYPATEWRDFAQTTFLGHPVTQLIHQCPFTYHSFSKPRGYAGDAELLDFIYGFKQPSQNLASLGKEIFDYWRYDATAPSSVRARRDVLVRTIDGVASEATHPTRILSIACGHLREAKESVAVQEGSIGQLVAFDQDPLSLEVIDREFDNGSIQTIRGSVTTLVRQKQSFENLDLVYAAGLYDYLSQPFATRLTKIMFDMLRTGGKLLVANFIPDHREVGYMETFMQWQLIYRTESQLADVAKEISALEIANKRTFFEDNGNIAFLELVKA